MLVHQFVKVSAVLEQKLVDGICSIGTRGYDGICSIRTAGGDVIYALLRWWRMVTSSSRDASWSPYSRRPTIVVSSTTQVQCYPSTNSWCAISMLLRYVRVPVSLLSSLIFYLCSVLVVSVTLNNLYFNFILISANWKGDNLQLQREGCWK